MVVQASQPRVASIAPGLPFLKTLVDSLLSGAAGIAFQGATSRDLSSATIFVPTRRAARALAAAFAAALQPRAVLLPRIVPLGDPVDLEDRAILSLFGPGDRLDELPPAIGDLERRFALMRWVAAWRDQVRGEATDEAEAFQVAGTTAELFALSGDLAALIDEMHIEGIGWAQVAKLAPERFDQYWRLTTTFLSIAAEHWPAFLAERELLDPADRIGRLLRAAASRLTIDRPELPFIVAGSTGSIPATADLIRAVSRLPQGLVVLPGLDLDLDEEAWSAVPVGPTSGADAGHPQAALKLLLSRLPAERGDVIRLGTPVSALASRERIVAESARVAAVTDRWPVIRQALMSRLTEGLADVSVLEAGDEREEALTIAVALRDAIENPSTIAALMTADRALARRVSLELERFGVTANDSAGVALSSLAPGGLALLALKMASADTLPLDWLALLRHPLVSLGLTRSAVEQATTVLELAAVRGLPARNGLAGLVRALSDAPARIADPHAPPPLKRVTPAALAQAGEVLTLLRVLDTWPAGRLPVAQHAERHRAILEALVRRDGEAEPSIEETGWAQLLSLYDDLVFSGADSIPVDGFEYGEIFRQALGERVVVQHNAAHGGIRIWGPLEARLLPADVLILGGMNEGTWPPTVRTDAFLNRPMRSELGLSPPERRIGQSAHDFAAAMGAPRVLLTRALTVEGTPTIASRFLRRLDAFIGATAAKALREPASRLLSIARALDTPARVRPADRPAPKPPVARRPQSLSFTEVETLYRDPYALYAAKSLKLKALKPIATAPGASERGSLIHDSLADFIKATPVWPADPLPLLIDIGRAHFERLDAPEVRAFWWPRFEAAARWFVDWEAARRSAVRHAHVEVRGRLDLTLVDGSPFALTGRADRIDILTNGSAALIDYKSGEPPGPKEVELGLAPQLTLEAAVAARGGFQGIEPTAASALMYVQLMSRGGKEKLIKLEQPIDEVATLHLANLVSAMSAYRSVDLGYVSRRRPKKTTYASDYDHLARVKEWSGGFVMEDDS
jgi:ATP-dependent helicase/nuclease subunit B